MFGTDSLLPQAESGGPEAPVDHANGPDGPAIIVSWCKRLEGGGKRVEWGWDGSLPCGQEGGSMGDSASSRYPNPLPSFQPLTGVHTDLHQTY